MRNAASLAPATEPVAPGELIALHAGGLASSTAIAPDGGPVYELNGVRVTINGIASALLSMTPDWITVQAPGSLGGDSAQVVVSNGGVVSNSVTVTLSASSPGIFSQDGSGTGIAAAWHADGNGVSSGSPAEPGETVTVFVAGVGTSLASANARAYVGGDGAAILSIDTLAGMVGVYRVQIALPATTPPGTIVPLGLGITTAFTCSVDIPIGRKTGEP